MQKLHIPSVRCTTVEYLRRPRQSPHDLGKRRIVEIRESRPGFIWPQAWQKTSSTTLASCARCFSGSTTVIGYSARLRRSVPSRIGREDIFVHEPPDLGRAGLET